MESNNSTIISRKLEQRIASRSLSLPILSPLAAQILQLVNGAGSDTVALSALLQSDRALADHVMHMANSAAYNSAAPMTSLPQAIARLGAQRIVDIATAASMAPKIFQLVGFDTLLKEMWLSSLATAVWAREIAQYGQRNAEAVFLCGLLFQIGRPIVLQTILDICQTENLAISSDDLSELMDHYQAEVGTLLADDWQLPLSVRHSINGVDIDTGAEGSQNIVDTIKAARVFAAYTMAGRQYDADSLTTNPCIVEINLYADDILNLLEKADSVHSALDSLSA